MGTTIIIGNGQLAQVFKDSKLNDAVLFASGVANSNCIEKKEFEREKNLLILTLRQNLGKKFIYFSSCALSADEYIKNDYYNHKLQMENIIKSYTDNYYIFRLPQLFGILKEHKTLINFIYHSITKNEKFKIYNHAYRYVIEINDVRLLVENYLIFSKPGITVDLANNYRYSIEEIVKIFEFLLNKSANYVLINKDDRYQLDLNSLNSFIDEHNINIKFSQDYLKNKLRKNIIQ